MQYNDCKGCNQPIEMLRDYCDDCNENQIQLLRTELQKYKQFAENVIPLHNEIVNLNCRWVQNKDSNNFELVKKCKELKQLIEGLEE